MSVNAENGVPAVDREGRSRGFWAEAWARYRRKPLAMAALVGGSVIIEQIFTWPGMGRLFFESIRERDYPTIMGLTLMFSALTLAGQLLADLLYCVVDPRVSVE